MGLLEQEIKELRQMNVQLANGEIKASEVGARIAIYSQIEKRAKLMLQTYALSAKFGNQHLTKISNTQLIGNGAVIDLDTGIEAEMVMCPDLDATITRKDCEDFSSATENTANCQSCRNYKTTRRLLKTGIGPHL